MVHLFIHSIGGAFLLVFASANIYSSALIVEPVQHYVAWVYEGEHDMFMELLLEREEPLTIVRIVSDITGDGQLEVLLSLYGLANGAEGLMWDVYTPVPDGYQIMGGLTFHPKAVYIGNFESYGWGIVKYFRSSSSSGTLVHSRIEGGRTVETTIREIYPKDNMEDMALYERLFSEENRPTIEEIPLSSVAMPDASVEGETTEPEAPLIPNASQAGSVSTATDATISHMPPNDAPSPIAQGANNPLLESEGSASDTPSVAVMHPSRSWASILRICLILATTVTVVFLLLLQRLRNSRME